MTLLKSFWTAWLWVVGWPVARRDTATGRRLPVLIQAN